MRIVLVEFILVIYFVLSFIYSSLSSKGPANVYISSNFKLINFSNIVFGCGSILIIALLLLVSYFFCRIIPTKSKDYKIFNLLIILFTVIFLILTNFSMSNGIIDNNTDLRQPTYIGYLSIQKSFFFITYFTSIIFVVTSMIGMIVFYIVKKCIYDPRS